MFKKKFFYKEAQMNEWRAVEILSAETINGRETSLIIFRQNNTKSKNAGLGTIQQIDNEYYFIARKSRGTLCTILLNYVNFCKLCDAVKSKRDIQSKKFSLSYNAKIQKYKLIFKGKIKLTLSIKESKLRESLLNLDFPTRPSDKTIKSLIERGQKDD